MRYLKASAILLLIWVLSACNLTRTPPTAEPITTQPGNASGKPAVSISSPEVGDEVVVNEDVFVSATASDTVGITRVQLIADNRIVKTVSSESPSGDQTMNVLLDYKPNSVGDVTLEVVAYRGAVASDPAAVDITVRASDTQVTATIVPATNAPVIDPNDPTCRALVNTGLNLRPQPNTDLPRITVLPAGTVVPIIGRVGNNTWWQVRYGTRVGWVAAEFTTVYGICTGIPVIATPEPPPTHTSTFIPSFTPVPSATLTPTPADLVITSIVGDTELTIPAGESSVSATYSVTITNTGNQNTGQFSNRVNILPGGTPVELGVVANLGRNESIALSIELTFDGAGDFTVRATADSDDEVQELSEVNNTGTLDLTVTNAS